MKLLLLALAAITMLGFTACSSGTHSGSFSGGGQASGGGTMTSH